MINQETKTTHYNYRGTGFQRTHKGHWIFDEPPSSCNAWERYGTNEETEAISDSTLDTEQALEIMHKMIDRNLAGHVVYNGDLRYRDSRFSSWRPPRTSTIVQAPRQR